MSSGSNDQVHFNAVRRALENGNAAVMVGAGFSRNAENGSELATWPDVAQELWGELNPGGKELQSFSASTVTQLGEQYARVFSKPSLEELLKRQIPDERVAPGELHRSLLSLPWSEILTTNYDTLLERAAESVVDRAHYTVTCREDIPQSKILGRRRIVKLHGSFPSQRPFIFTEEDYRRYPETSAPFINLVRQSMLENVFCLIGFSGDDPNFLHWIGWVRDMLDEHALPIYLFVARPSPLGTQKLLDVRRVTEVVLPTKEGVEEWDYAARFALLFEILTKPLTPDVTKWGTHHSGLGVMRTSGQSIAQRHEQLVAAFAGIRELRNTYPGWFVAPHNIRSRLFSSVTDLHHLLSRKLVNHFLKEAPHAAIAVLADYSWHLDVLLQSMNDEVAVLSVDLLSQVDPTAAIPFEGESGPATDLRKLQVQDPQEFRQRWKELALGVLRWAREGVREHEYHCIRELLRSHFPTDFQVTDQLVYEDILLRLYTGDRDLAHQLLKSWDVRSPDNYMMVRKGVLLGELGEVANGLKIALVGLKRLRRNQRSRANSVHTLSQEAWACLAIGNLQKSRQNRAEAIDDKEPLEFLPELVTQRLVDLAADGHDVRRDMLLLNAELSAETPAPAAAVSHVPHFELGRWSTTRHHGPTSPYRYKVLAAFAWLALSDRVALVPRVGNSTFEIDSFAQAAWWIQENDSRQRVLSVMMRLVYSKLLEPRKATQLVHSAGWLSRFQVAKTTEPLAQVMVGRSMSFLERVFQETISSDVMERTIGFHLEVMSRLVIRCASPGFAASILARITKLHTSKQLLPHPSLWEHVTAVIVHSFEAMSALERLAALPTLASLPDRQELNITNHIHATDWFSLHLLSRRTDERVIGKPSEQISLTVDALINRLRVIEVSESAPEQDQIQADSLWARLFWLRGWGCVSRGQTTHIGKILLNSKHWPIIPGHYSWAIFVWLNKTQKNSAARRYREWILAQELTRFSSAKASTDGLSQRSWSMRDADDFLMNLYRSLEHFEWAEDEFVSSLRIIKCWWDEEWPFIAAELGKIDEVKSLLLRRMEWVDLLISSFIDKQPGNPLLRFPDISMWVGELQTGMLEVGPGLLRTRLAIALEASDNTALSQVDVALFLSIFESGLSEANRIAKVISYWVNHPRAGACDAPSGLVYALASAVSGRRMPALPSALRALTAIASVHPEWITPSGYLLMNAGLKKLLSELSYDSRPEDSVIPDDNVPELRLACVLLVRALQRNKIAEVADVCACWLDEAANDPLPELRFS
ncbi:SIR2 family protein [Pseudomonas sp. NPDC088444]|uniref:SIR2 family protein n=1 Tax=Pseudomonas sp. NPDC088444 TaxID=3364456 RepID=UPI00384BA4E8